MRRGSCFLIVPGLLLATRMPMINAVGSSLLAVGCFSLATAINYAFSGLVDWLVAGQFIAGGLPAWRSRTAYRVAKTLVNASLPV
jgi:uncharacterized membrane protein YfcA